MEPDRDVETAYLGRFHPMEAPVVIDLLRDHGIFAMMKASPDSGGVDPYGFPTGRGDVLVDRERLAEARRLVDEVLPELLVQMQRNLEDQFGGDPAP
jgi:hypothetical protein